MNEKINLFNLVDTISSRTKQNPELVKRFITQLFKETEKELSESSFVNIEGLGIFRIIKSLPADRILFLGNFENDKKASETNEDDVENKRTQTINQVNTKKDTINESSFIDEIPPEVNEGNAHTNELTSFDEINSFENDDFLETSDDNNDITDDESQPNDESIDFLFEYENHEKEETKRKRFSNIRIIVLLIITIIGVIVLLMFLYPKEKRDDLSTPIVNKPAYLMLENNDTINCLHIIVAESELDFATLSQIFYDYGKFWPYIYKANEKDISISSTFGIKAGTVIKIPKLEKELIDKNNKYSVDKAQAMVDEILKLRGNTAATE